MTGAEKWKPDAEWPPNAEYVPDADAPDTYVLDERPFQVMPPLNADEYAALKASIEENGVRERIAVWKGQEKYVIDGHHRVLACRELGRNITKEQSTRLVDLPMDEALDLAWELNLQQRHLDDGAKKDAIERRLKQFNEEGRHIPDTKIAENLGVSETWVREVRHKLEARGNIRTTADITADTGGRRTDEDTERKRDEVAAAIREAPEKSNREIARECGVSHPFVGGVRETLAVPELPGQWFTVEESENGSFVSYRHPTHDLQILQTRCLTPDSPSIDIDTFDEDGERIEKSHGDTIYWSVTLRSREFFDNLADEWLGIAHGWNVAHARGDSRFESSRIVEEFAQNYETYLGEKEAELKESGRVA